MQKNVVILGGGTGGTMVANHLSKLLKSKINSGEVKLVMVTDSDKHIYQPGNLFIAFGKEEPERYVKKQEKLLPGSVDLLVTKAKKVDRFKKVVETENGEVPYDYLVVATGSVPRFDSVPGMVEAADEFYTAEGAVKLRDKLFNFEGGKVVVNMGVPHKCPVAPIEVTLMMHDLFEQRGILDKVEIVYTYPVENVHLLAPVANWLKPELEKRSIRYKTQFIAEKVDPDKKEIYATNGDKESFDLLISIPKHTGAEVVFNSEGLGNPQGWIEVNKYTLKHVDDDYIYVVGDAHNIQGLSKAGSTAHYMSEYVAKNIVAELEGNVPSHYFPGKVFCFIETAAEEATYITMTYKNPPKPVPTSQLLYTFKVAFNEMYWLAAKGMI